METSFSTAISGMQTIISRQDIAANNVANVNTPGFKEYSARQTDVQPAGVRIANISRVANLDAQNSNTDLAVQAVEQLKNKNEFKANAAVIKTQDKMLGALLDIIA